MLPALDLNGAGIGIAMESFGMDEIPKKTVFEILNFKYRTGSAA